MDLQRGEEAALRAVAPVLRLDGEALIAMATVDGLPDALELGGGPAAARSPLPSQLHKLRSSSMGRHVEHRHQERRAALWARIFQLF